MALSVENPFDNQGREWFIPPCTQEIRVASDGDRVNRNPDIKPRTETDFNYISYGQGPDGDMIVNCAGNGESCPGGKVIVDRHDILSDRMPLTTDALRRVCRARKMYLSDHGFIKLHSVIDD